MEMKSGTQRTQRAAEGTEKSAGQGRRRRKPKTTGKGMGFRSKSTGCIPGAPGLRLLGRDPGAPGITSGYAGSRFWRARATRATVHSVSSVVFRVFRDQPGIGEFLGIWGGTTPHLFSVSSAALCVLCVPAFTLDAA